MWRTGLLIAVLFVRTTVVAQTGVHRPVATGSCSAHVGGDINDASAVVWVPLAQKWIVTDQRSFFVFSRDGVLEKQSAVFVTCKGATEHEGFTLVDSPRCSNDPARRCYTASDCAAPATCSVPGPYGDVLWSQEEDLGSRCTNDPTTTCADDAGCGGVAGQFNLCKGAGALCRYSINAILHMGEGTNPSTPVALEEVWATDIPRNSSEGVVFVPDGSGNGRYGGTFYWSEQANARWRRFSLDASQPVLVWGSYPSFPAGCALGGDLSDGYYDFVNGRFYSQSDGGNRYVVHSPDFLVCYSAIADPVTCRADNGYEGMAFGGGRLAYVDDFTGHPDDGFNGLWLFEDDYCGDGVRVSTEACDRADLNGKTCGTASAGSCQNGHCGPGWTGSLGCRADCAKFDDGACVATVSGVTNLRRTDVH
jgi:hypothetical protein